MPDLIEMPPSHEAAEREHERQGIAPADAARAYSHEAAYVPPPLEMHAEPSDVKPVFGSLERMDVKRDATSTAIAIILHVVIIALIFFLVARKVGLIAPPKPVENITLVEPPPPPPKAPPKAITMGGGGGQKGPTPVTRGNPPKFAPTQLNPPKAPPLEQPKINVPVTVDVQTDLKMAKSNVPQIGMPNSPLVGLSMGNGKGTGLGAGTGAGIGAGSGGNIGGGVRRIGGGVSAPVVLYKPEPEFSEEARKAKVGGDVIVYLQINEEGKPEHVRVVRGIGMGLDEKAVAAVKQYRFKPAMENGHPVRVELQIDVDFQIY